MKYGKRGNVKMIYNVKQCAEEFDAYYATYDPCTAPLLNGLKEIDAQAGGLSSYAQKAKNIAYICDNAPVHLFRNAPFFFEFSSGRGRHTWGGLQSPVGSFLHDKTAPLWLNLYEKESASDRAAGRVHCWNNPVGFDHFSLGYDTILSQGFHGIIARAACALTHAEDEKARQSLQAMIDASNALLRLAARFAAQANALAAAALSFDEKTHYLHVADMASRVPAEPPRTMEEALCAILFCREAIGTVEGIGVSTFGHLDRMLYPFYAADLKAGRINPERAENLFELLLAYTAVRFEADTAYNETSTTIMVGGCNLDGSVCYNPVTEAILDAVLQGRWLNTKINCRVSAAHPRAYFEKLAAIQTANIPAIVMLNDDVIIPARVRCGEDLADARTYVAGGCHEVTLQNTMVNTRADTWINLPRLLLDVLSISTANTFDAFYAQVMERIADFIHEMMARKNKYEKLWSTYDPLPLVSATLTGCIEGGRDATDGGTKYAQTALSLLAPATLIDSLWSVKTLVYDTAQITLAELYRLCQTNFDDNPRLQAYIVNRIPKYGTDNDELNAFAPRVLHDIAAVYRDENGNLYKNGRGGNYLPAFYPHDIHRDLGLKTIATPDGRRAFTTLSRGCSPSEFIEVKNPADIIRSVSHIDFTEFADSFVTDITLQRMEPSVGRDVLIGLLTLFLKAGGSSLQFNMLDHAGLLLAREHPELHRDICVRVCGYSAVFVTLSRQTQDEIIARAIR